MRGAVVMEDLEGRDGIPQLDGIATFLADHGAYLIWNQNGCGKHKTTDTANAIIADLRAHLGRRRYVVCTPTFKMLEGFRNWEGLLQAANVRMPSGIASGNFTQARGAITPGATGVRGRLIERVSIGSNNWTWMSF